MKYYLLLSICLLCSCSIQPEMYSPNFKNQFLKTNFTPIDLQIQDLRDSISPQDFPSFMMVLPTSEKHNYPAIDSNYSNLFTKVLQNYTSQNNSIQTPTTIKILRMRKSILGDGLGVAFATEVNLDITLKHPQIGNISCSGSYSTHYSHLFLSDEKQLIPMLEKSIDHAVHICLEKLIEVVPQI